MAQRKTKPALLTDPVTSHGFLPFRSEQLLGILGDDALRFEPEKWALPALVLESSSLARAGYDSCKSHEYQDEPDVLREKIALLAALIQRAANFVVYSGAGLSTASGIGDYGSAASSSAITDSARPPSHFDALPTLAHRVLVSLFRTGFLKHWVQQNHDGLPQKAGFPQEHINEIHGAWYAPDNPVIPMSGTLRGDLVEWMTEWEQKSDLVLAVYNACASSMTGFHALYRVTSSTERASPESR